ncbi:NAD(P)-dependent oxidoreductase [Flavobacterium rhizosphaerae]|uniref:NAD(P)H-binding protein n=1 Tax=Flavobacterium rhizosphaerae TaxID=3163298 RepID=A0ABW8YZS5_9FLAO
MKTHKKVAVIGGTGKSGRYLVNTLLHCNYNIKMLVRNPERAISHNAIETVVGTVQDYKAVVQCLQSCDAVISTLGLGIPPSAPDIFTIATSHILKAMAETGSNRYIVTTGLNVDTPFDAKGGASKAATEWMYNNYPVSTKNQQQEYELLTKSNSDWTMVRLPIIQLVDENPDIAVSLEDCPGTAIAAPALARFLIHQMHDSSYSKQAPFIANK